MIGKLIHAAFSETKTFSDVWEEVKENPASAFASTALDVGLCFIPGAGWGAVAAVALALRWLIKSSKSKREWTTVLTAANT